MKLAIFTVPMMVGLFTAGTALAYNEGDERDSRLCSEMVVPLAYEIYNQKKQGYSPQDSFDQLSAAFQEQMNRKPPATGPGADIKNDFWEGFTEHYTDLIHDMVLDAANRPFFNPDKTYPQYVLRCITDVQKIKADIGEKHRDELQQFRD